MEDGFHPGAGFLSGIRVCQIEDKRFESAGIRIWFMINQSQIIPVADMLPIKGADSAGRAGNEDLTFIRHNGIIMYVEAN